MDFGSVVEVFRDILVYTTHIGHYNMMMQIEEDEVVIVEGRTSGFRVNLLTRGAVFQLS